MFNDSRHLYEFENFRLDAENSSLWCEGELVSIPPKVLETLILLVERNGEIVSRDELLEKVWKETFVEEGNINYTISQLRKILGEKNLIQTVPKHGYRFLGKIGIVSTNLNPKNTEIPISVKTETYQLNLNKPKSKFRWAILAAFLLGILFVTIFAFRSNKQEIKSATEQTSGETRPATVEALHIYQRGKMILEDRDTEKKGERAVEEFQRAITLDPTLAIAYSGLAEGLVSLAVAANGKQSDDFYAKAKMAVNKAIVLDENLAEAFATRGLIKRNFDWDWKGAEADFIRATELKPNYALAHIHYAHLLSVLGRQDESLAEINKAYLLDPLSEIVLASQFAVLEARGEYDEGIKKAEQFLSVNPDNTFVKRGLGTFLYHKGEYARVIEIGEKVLEKATRRKPFAWLSLVAASYQKMNQLDKADALLKELELQSESDSKPLYSLAMNYAEANRIDDAIAALEKCFQVREERMIWLNIEPRLVNLRTDGRLMALVQKMKLN